MKKKSHGSTGKDWSKQASGAGWHEDKDRDKRRKRREAKLETKRFWNDDSK